MGIVLEFSPRPPEGHDIQSAVADKRLRDAYRHDMERALQLISDYAASDEYDGLVAILRPRAGSAAPIVAVAGLYRHQLSEAANASIFLHQTIKRHMHAAELAVGEEAQSTDEVSTDAGSRNMQDTDKIDLWKEATQRYYRCERLLRVAFSQQLRASQETTELLMRVTQLPIETVSDVLWELVRVRGDASARTRMEVLKAIKDFAAARRQVAAWMPPAGEEEAYFAQHADYLCADILASGLEELGRAEATLVGLVGDAAESVVGK
ncbi:hypothetical protein [Ralstonia pseudosolanacearum]|nr:hypothetical protein [Ralstonia sp. RS642]OIT12570.1 hypothetical protein BL241_08165 [Ralstonia solanacearum]UZF26656.1 hypothetical protein LGV80_09160 [Ralstonia sp. RS642]BCL86681.1 hypothetical protein MAFF211471_17640 [Ralstonia solanacearum]BCM99230.1 hypothetical protein RPSA_17670 [Ralstonia solanacearum]